MFIHAFCLHHVDGLVTETLKFGCVLFVLNVGSSRVMGWQDSPSGSGCGRGSAIAAVACYS